MNIKRLAIVLAVPAYYLFAVWFCFNVFGFDAWPSSYGPGAWLGGFMFGAFGAVGLFFAFILALLIPELLGNLFGALWEWLRDKPAKATVVDHRPGTPVQRAAALERWHALYDRGIDPDSHKCLDEWFEEEKEFGPTGIYAPAHRPCSVCREIEKELVS